MILLTLRLLMGMKACKPGIIWFCKQYGECAEVDVQRVVNDLLADHHADYAYWLFERMRHLCKDSIFNTTSIESSDKTPIIIMSSVVAEHVNTKGPLYVAGDLDAVTVKADTILCNSLTVEELDTRGVISCSGNLYVIRLRHRGSINVRKAITLRGDAEVTHMSAGRSILIQGSIKAMTLRALVRITIRKDAEVYSRISCGGRLRVNGAIVQNGPYPPKITAGFDCDDEPASAVLIGEINED